MKFIFKTNRLNSNSYEKSWADIKDGFNSLFPTSNLIFFIEQFKDELKEEIYSEYQVLRNNMKNN